MIYLLSEAKDFIRERFTKGSDCPCCGQFVKLYKRQITPDSVDCLIKLYGRHKNLPEETWHHIRGFANIGGDFAKLRFWGLVEEKETSEDGGKSTGYWRISENGRRFVEGRHYVQQYAHIYNGTCQNLSGPRINVVECLKNKFSYDELMGTI